MKLKKLIVTYILLITIGANITVYGNQTSANELGGSSVIPEDAIRLRILANSDSEQDQIVKRQIRDKVNAEISEWVEDLTSFEDAKDIISQRIKKIEEIVDATLAAEGVSQTYTVQFSRVEFPTKLYGSYIYPAGTYDAVLITLGEGQGANWWCVLFPPLCFLDFSNSEAVKKDEDKTTEAEKAEIEESDKENEEDKVVVRFFLIELIAKLF
ncbi:stage II sporulation protein R [Bacillus sp. HMF5848]|uniref:stage II sporulation protein R n=1 Tax=Bacillus sp. HMF5848 TaxID=2495421 RepID=UPI000F7B0CEE|nr:stage II sporulation protein R [Bacillus sp. HMF5848]RSK28958.1 stage II sporulation protein R [Bacillus sp. HMF5848]